MLHAKMFVWKGEQLVNLLLKEENGGRLLVLLLPLQKKLLLT